MTAPMIWECPVCLVCRLVQVVPLPTNTLFIREITGVYADGRVIHDNTPYFEATGPLLLTMPDNRHWTLGKYARHAWSAGKTMGEGSHTKP